MKTYKKTDSYSGVSVAHQNLSLTFTHGRRHQSAYRISLPAPRCVRFPPQVRSPWCRGAPPPPRQRVPPPRAAPAKCLGSLGEPVTARRIAAPGQPITTRQHRGPEWPCKLHPRCHGGRRSHLLNFKLINEAHVEEVSVAHGCHAGAPSNRPACPGPTSDLLGALGTLADLRLLSNYRVNTKGFGHILFELILYSSTCCFMFMLRLLCTFCVFFFFLCICNFYTQVLESL